MDSATYFSRLFQEDNYILPMIWMGMPVRMLCPQVRGCSSKPTVACYSEGMVVKIDWPLSEIYVKGKFYQLLLELFCGGF